MSLEMRLLAVENYFMLNVITSREGIDRMLKLRTYLEPIIRKLLSDM